MGLQQADEILPEECRQDARSPDCRAEGQVGEEAEAQSAAGEKPCYGRPRAESEDCEGREQRTGEALAAGGWLQ